MGPSSAMQFFGGFFACHGDARLTVVGANNSFILSAQEMNHRCNLIRLCHNLALCATALFFRACVGTVSGLCHSLYTQFNPGSPKLSTPALVLVTALSGGSNGGRIIVILASYFMRCIGLYGNVCVHVCLRARACVCGSAVIESVREGWGGVGGGGASLSLSLSICLSRSLFLKLPHHAAPVDWRYSHIYYAGG